MFVFAYTTLLNLNDRYTLKGLKTLSDFIYHGNYFSITIATVRLVS